MENIMTTALRYAAYIGIGYALLMLAVYVLQRNLLYFPDRDKPTAEQLAATGLSFWPNESDYRGLVAGDSAESKGTVIAFHGNAGSARHRYYVAHGLAPLGYRVIIAEYPGYGGRSGKMSEKSFVADAQAIIAAARKDFGNPIYLFGESMGCGVAAAVAHTPSGTVSGLILVTPWDSLANLAQTHYWYLPARWLAKDRFDSVKNLHPFTRPVAVAMAENDTVIPNKHTLRLYAMLNAPKRLWRFENAGHNSWPTGPNEQWWREAMGFIAAFDAPHD
jgi:alpha-beta hydrolase superfamily lysophospholipase